jgi:hypothetical protein
VDSKKDIGRALAELGWETRQNDEGSETVVGSYGKYHLMVSFEGTRPTSVIISYVGKGGGMLSRKWPGKERLPTPRKVVQALSKHK